MGFLPLLSLLFYSFSFDISIEKKPQPFSDLWFFVSKKYEIDTI